VLREVIRTTTTLAMLVNPAHPNAENQVRDVQEAARPLGVRVHVLNARNSDELDVAFASLAQLRVDSFFVSSDPFLTSQRDQIVAEVARQRIPASYPQREFAVAGGLMSYGNDLADTYRQVGVYAGRVLNGAKPAELPVMQPTKFEFVINLKTAKALGVTISDNLLSLADEVIE
jgi:putative ABC transport system substrate-binding protein